MNDDHNWKFIILAILVCSLQVLPFIFWPKTAKADNVINVDQIGNNNSITINQQGSNNSATVTTGYISDVDYSVFSIVQQGSNKTASIELKSGINNTVNIQQDGAGNHTANIQNFIGSGNSLNITQSGDGNHSFTVTNPNSQPNNGNTVTALQTGGIGADKTFNLYFNGATGATVNVQQTNPTQPDQGGMNIQCTTCSGTWSYLKF